MSTTSTTGQTFPATGDPIAGFEGRIGRTLADSMPHWRPAPQAPAGSPNLVVILLDDLGFSDFGCFGGDIDTPNVDELASGGLRYSNYTTVPMCTPARAALLTGKNPHSVGCGWLTHNDPGYPGYKGEMSLDAPTLAEVLRGSGWSTMAAGKWHNTYDQNAHIGGDTRSWPLQRGFDRFYGFLGAETSYFHPERMMEGNQQSPVDQYPSGYYAPDDYTSRAIGWLAEHRASAPDKPFFLYLAFQTPHAPLQAPLEDIRRMRGRFDAGWDELRQARLARQRQLGVIPDEARLPPLNPNVPAWERLDPEERAWQARCMEVYAAAVSNADANIGRLVRFLRASGCFDNTLILITSDNGANAVGGPQGLLNLQDHRAGMPERPDLRRRMLEEDRVGAHDTWLAYPTGWTQLSNTPYRFYKRTPMAGGIRVPLVASWPAGIGAGQAGQVRRQWVHVTDILPTVLDLTGARRPDQFNGLRTRPVDGVSFAPSLRDAQAPSGRSRQYYELAGNRGYVEGPWKIVSLQVPRQALKDQWMLFDIVADPSEIRDLAADQPGILARMVRRFEEEAGANYVYPIDTRDEQRTVMFPPYLAGRIDAPRDFLPGGAAIPTTVMGPLVGGDRSYRLVVRFDWQAGQEGVIYALGDRFAGAALYVLEGRLHYVHQWWFSPTELSPVSMNPGEQIFELDYRAVGGRRGQASICLNGQPVCSRFDMSPTLVRLPSGGLSIGLSRRQAVSERYEGRGRFAYGGRIESLRIEPGLKAPDSKVITDEVQAQTILRQGGSLG
jgi:arylsulfatase A-like enzyme